MGRADEWGFRNPPAQCALNGSAIINQINRGLLTVCASQGGGLLGVVKSLALSEKARIGRRHSGIQFISALIEACRLEWEETAI